MTSLKLSGDATHIENLLFPNKIDFQEFAHAIEAWLSCADKKRNTLFIWGRPNSGKSLIAKLISEVFITKTFSNMDAASQFVFGNLIDSSLILIEEPFLVPVLLEDFKKLTEGSNMCVNVKYQEPQTLGRTPVLITSNFSTLSHGHAPAVSEAAIKLRSFIFHFSSEFVPTCVITVADFVSFLNKYVG